MLLLLARKQCQLLRGRGPDHKKGSDAEAEAKAEAGANWLRPTQGRGEGYRHEAKSNCYDSEASHRSEAEAKAEAKAEDKVIVMNALR